MAIRGLGADHSSINGAAAMAEEPKVNILLVDDQPSNLLSLEAILSTLRQNLIKARSGREALRCLLDNDVALILLDVQMPGMDGLETAALIRQRERSQHTPIIFLTAYEHTDVQLFEGYSLGAVDFLTKPFMPEVLRSKVSVFVELYRKTEKIKRQAELLRAQQETEHQHRLAEERQRWEMERLRLEAAREKQVAEELARNVDERIGVEKELRAVKDELAVQLADMTCLHQLSIRLSKTLELQPLLDEVVRAATELVRTDLGLLRLIDPERKALRLCTSRGLTEEYLRRFEHLPLGVGPWGRAIKSHEPEVVANVNADPHFGPFLDIARTGGFQAVCCVPLLTRADDIIGTLTIFFREPRQLSEAELRVLQLYCRQAAEVLDNARLYNEIQDANRRKDEFLAMLAHELRNPLAPLLNALHILRLPNQPADVGEQVRDIAERQVHHLAHMVDDLLDVSRITRGKIQLRKETLEISDLICRVRDGVQGAVEEKDHRLDVTLPGEPVYLEADPTRLEQILTNLLNNAIKYTEPGGRIALTAERDNGDVVLRVRDTGVGIAPEMLPTIFDLFIQGDRSLARSQGGLGIGLSLVRSLVQLHGGSVQATSEGLGKGSEFCIRLPALVDRPAPAPVDGEGSPSHPSAGRRVRILVVDDNDAAADSLAMLLRLWGHEVHTVYDGTTALEAASTQRPELVFMDIGLPGMDGYEVARLLRQRWDRNKMVLVAITGYGQEEDRRRAREAGFDLHMVKPVDPDQLQEVLASIGTESLMAVQH
jgi:signal transduction histidine kinase/response regulator RpfG family c-di-GMP phosphodiesterase